MYVEDVESAIFIMWIEKKERKEKVFWEIRRVRVGNYKWAKMSHARKSLLMKVCEQAWSSQGLLLCLCVCVCVCVCVYVWMYEQGRKDHFATVSIALLPD